MKHRKKKNVYSWLIGVVLILIVLILVMIGWLFLNREAPAEAVAPTQTQSVQPQQQTMETPEPTVQTAAAVNPDGTVNLKDGSIVTPYGTLQYPEAFSDHLIIVNSGTEPYTLEFYAALEDREEVRLFDISLGEGSGGNLGLVETPLGAVPLNVTIYALTQDETWSDGEFLTAQAMQDVVNEMIDQLAPKAGKTEAAEPVIAGQPGETDSVKNLEIETPVCNLYYPARWDSYLRTEQEDTQESVYKVHFYGELEGKEKQHLFSIYFGGDDGEQLGAVMSADGIPVPVNLVMGDLGLDGWEDEEQQILFSMQEASNQVIAKLPLL